MKDDKVYFDLQRVPLKSEREEIRNRRKKILLIVLICLFFFTAGLGGGYLLYRVIHLSYKVDANGTMGEIEYWMKNNWLYSDQHEDLVKEMEDKAFYGMTSFENDIYTSYMSDEEMNEFSTSINMNYVGIGVEYTTIDGLSIVKTVFKNSPA
ncbi:MAG: hypothetical protein IKX97_08530, partial [Erysipelotrichaceae bacterium]|nr:hypothetical protein [Erysipelotrichaceae bacterium]